MEVLMDTGEFIKSLEKLGSQYIADYTKNFDRYAKFVGGLVQQPPEKFDAGKAQERYIEFLRTEAPRVTGAVAEAGLTYYSALMNTGMESVSRYLDQMIQPGTAPAAARAESKQPAALLFHGNHGEWPSNAFVVSNSRSEAVDIRLEVTEATADDGSSSFLPKAKFVPDSFRLAPKSEQVVQCSLQLTNHVHAGKSYRAQIRAVGFPEMTVRISIRVDESAPSPRKSGKKSKMKRGASSA